MNVKPTNVAIACQGGGSQTAFSAGALSAVLTDPGFGTEFRVVGLSGTSGGAICSLLTWYGLLRHAGEQDRGRRTAELLQAFWADDSAHEWWDAMLNQYVVWLRRLQDAGAVPQLAPAPPVRQYVQDQLRALIERHVDFEDIPGLLEAHPDHASLYFGAVDVLSGEFAVFEENCPYPRWHRALLEDRPPEVSVLPVLASAAVPPTLPGVTIGAGRYWDGLFAYNPPIRVLLERDFDHRPDEIWVVQIDPEDAPEEPTGAAEIVDRKFELSSNLSLNGEIHWVKQINLWIEEGKLSPEQFKPVRVARIQMSRPVREHLDLASKVDRSPAYLSALIADGQKQTKAFLDQRPGGDWWEPAFPHTAPATVPA
jgi:NTE family protein